MKWLLPILSLVMFSCAPPWDVPGYDTIFQKDNIVEWNIYTSSEDWLKLIADPMSWPCSDGELGPDCQSDPDCPLTCRCREGTCITHYVEAEVWVDGRRYYPVGLRLMGTKRRAKRNLRIRFNQFIADQRFHGVKRVNIRNNAGDPSLIREALALELMRKAGIPAPRYSFVWVSVNGDSGGLYTLVQQVDKKFLESSFMEDFGNLYMLERGGNLLYEGDDPDAYYPPFEQRYELKTNELTADGSDLIKLMRVLAQGDPRQDLPEVLDVEAWLRLLAVNSWFANMDSYPGTVDNLYLYHDAAGRFRSIPWDLNEAFGNYDGGTCWHTTDDLIRLDPDDPACGDVRPLVNRVLGENKYLDCYHRNLRELIDGVLNPDAVIAEMESMRAHIRDRAGDDVLKDQDDGYSIEDFEAAFENDVPPGDNPVRVPGLKPFVLERDRVIRENLF